jgi:predicted amidohydrolase
VHVQNLNDMKSTLLNLALLQFPLVWESPEENKYFFEEKIMAGHTQSPDIDLWVLPEMWSTGFSMNLVKNARNIGATSLSFMIDMALKTQSAVAGEAPFLKKIQRCLIVSFLYFQMGPMNPMTKDTLFLWPAKVRCM